MIFQEDILIHKEFEKEGTHILDINKYKAALKNAILFKYKKNFKLLSNEKLQQSYYFHNKGFLSADNKKYFINFWPHNNNNTQIDSFHFKFFKNLTNNEMIELRNIILKFGKKHKSFQFQYDDFTIFVLFPSKWKYSQNYKSQFCKLNNLFQ